jgi:hypothetical protein
MGYLVTVVPAMVLGFLAGLWSFKGWASPLTETTPTVRQSTWQRG